MATNNSARQLRYRQLRKLEGKKRIVCYIDHFTRYVLTKLAPDYGSMASVIDHAALELYKSSDQYDPDAELPLINIHGFTLPERTVGTLLAFKEAKGWAFEETIGRAVKLLEEAEG